ARLPLTVAPQGDLHRRVIGLRVEQVAYRRLVGLVVLGHGSGDGHGGEQVSVALGVHDEGVPAVRAGGQGRPGAVGHIAFPGFLLLVPAHHPLLRRVRTSLDVAGGTIVKDAAVDRPSPGPLGIQAKPVDRVGFVSPGHQVAGLVIGGHVGTGHDPATTGGAAVVAQEGEGGHLVALPEGLALGREVHVSGKVAVDLAGDPVGAGAVPAFLVVIPVQVDDGFGENAALGILLLDRLDQVAHDLQIRPGIPWGFLDLVAPLSPSARVGHAALLLHRGGGGEEEDLGVDRGGIYAWALPEDGGVGLPQVHADEPFQPTQRLPFGVGVGAAYGGVLAPHHRAFHLTGQHALENGDVGVVAVALGEVVVGEVVGGARMLTPPGFQQAHQVLGPVLPPVGRARIGGLGRVAGPVNCQGHVLIGGGREVAGKDVVQQARIGAGLDVALAAHGIDAAAGHADVAQQQLQDGIGPDVLGTVRVLGGAHRVEHSH